MKRSSGVKPANLFSELGQEKKKDPAAASGSEKKPGAEAATEEPPEKKAKLSEPPAEFEIPYFDDDDGPEAWGSIFGGESAEKEQPYLQFQLPNLPYANEDGEVEQIEDGLASLHRG